MKLNMLHFTICNKIISDLDCTLIVSMKNSWGFDREPDFTQELLDPNNVCANSKNTMIFWFSNRQRDNLLFLWGLDQRAKIKAKKKNRSQFLIIIVTYPIKVSVADQGVWTSTVFDKKVRCSLQIVDDILCILPMTFSRILHEAGHQADNKGIVWSTMSEVN